MDFSHDLSLASMPTVQSGLSWPLPCSILASVPHPVANMSPRDSSLSREKAL
jgi:hypothetical protein